MTKKFGPRFIALIVSILAVGSMAGVAFATHSWGSYHWARTANPFTLKLGDNVAAAWDSALAGAASDWTQSTMLDTALVSGSTNPKNCRPKSGRVEVCDSKYGNNGWLGLASIWASGKHITQGTVKLNDTYFNTAKYNTPVWRNFVMCQEIGHTLGLDHQDENFDNPNLGTCMDYTSNPIDNQHPNAHDYDMLEQIYEHLDAVSTVDQSSGIGTGGKGRGANGQEIAEWGKALRYDGKGRPSLFVQDLGRDEKVFTFVIWAE